MAFLSRSDLEAIGARVAEAYQQLPGAAEAPFERVNIDRLISSLLACGSITDICPWMAEPLALPLSVKSA